MRRIFISLLTVILAIGAVSASAYALFSSTASVSGITFATGDAELKVYLNGAWGNSRSLGESNLFKNLYPKQNLEQDFYLKNTSSSPIALTIFGKLIGNASTLWTNWNELKDVISLKFQSEDDSGWHDITGYATLANWHTSGYGLNSVLAQNDQKHYKMLVKVADIDNNLSGKSLSSLLFEFTGTQQ